MLDVRTLTDGGQRGSEVMAWIEEFVGRARQSLDFAHYDLNLQGDCADAPDDVVSLGSFNLSRSGERNAENVLELEHAELASRLADYIDEVRGTYPAFAFAD